MRLKRSSHEPKRRNLTPLIVFILLYPYIVGYSSDSTDAYTELLVGAGGGQYARHDCSSAHKQGFGDAGVYVGRKLPYPIRMGLSFGGIYTGPNGGGGFVYPDLGLEWEYFALGTTGARIGSTRDLFLEWKILDRPPFFSGTGLARVGVGKYFADLDSRFWIGMNSYPYASNGAAIGWEMPISEKRFLYFNGRYGTDASSGIKEFGVSAGVRIITP
jgi:hypothetical protein